MFYHQQENQKQKAENFLIWAGAVAYALTMVTFVIANRLTTSANVIMLQYSAPVWAALLGWLLIKEKPHWEHWLALVCVFGGLILFFRDGLSSGHILGNIIALLSGVVFGAFSVFLRMQKEGDPSDSILLSHIICFIIAIPFIIIYRPDFVPVMVLQIGFMGIFQIGCASLLFSYGIKHVSAVQAMLTSLIELLLNPIWVLVITGERPTGTALLGGGIILAAVLFCSFVGKRRAV